MKLFKKLAAGALVCAMAAAMLTGCGLEDWLNGETGAESAASSKASSTSTGASSTATEAKTDTDTPSTPDTPSTDDGNGDNDGEQETTAFAAWYNTNNGKLAIKFTNADFKPYANHIATEIGTDGTNIYVVLESGTVVLKYGEISCEIKKAGNVEAITAAGKNILDAVSAALPITKAEAEAAEGENEFTVKGVKYTFTAGELSSVTINGTTYTVTSAAAQSMSASKDGDTIYAKVGNLGTEATAQG